MRRTPLHEELIIGGDLNGMLERSNFEREHGGHGYGQQNPEGESILSLAQAYTLVVANLLPVSRNHQGHRGATADIGDNPLPSLTVFGCSLTAVEVETGPLSDVVFPSFLLPASFSFP